MAKNKNKKTDQKICKKCGTPLPSTWKYKYCENCRRDRAETRRNVIAGVAGVATPLVIAKKDKILPLAQKAAPYIKSAVNTVARSLRK